MLEQCAIREAPGAAAVLDRIVLLSVPLLHVEGWRFLIPVIYVGGMWIVNG